MVRRLYGVNRWHVAFYGTPRLFGVDVSGVLGRFAHCFCFGYCARTDCWVRVDVTRGGVGVTLYRPDELGYLLSVVDRMGGEIVSVPRCDVGFGQWNWFGPRFCVPAIRRVIRMRGRSMRVESFFRECLRSGRLWPREMVEGYSDG